MPYTIREQMLSDEDLIECYHQSILYCCDPEFIAILSNSIAARGLAKQEKGGGGDSMDG
jgi:DNA-binding phage protein